MADIGENVGNVKGEVCPPLPAGTMKRAALAYAEQGLKIFPCHCITSRGACSCGDSKCKKPGKHPRTAHGYDDATADVKTVADWWSTWPEANIGLACSANYMVALDVDPRHGGDEDFAELEATHGPINSSIIADSGGGGRHYLFSFSGPKNVELVGKLGTRKGIDVKFRGYILVAPSNHLSGRRYAWRDGMAPVADAELGGIVAPPLPGWIRDLKPATTKAKTTSKPVDLGWYRFAAATMAIPNGGDEYDRDGWLKIGAAIHAQADGSENGLSLFLEWSALHQTFDAAETERVYRSFSTSRTGAAVTGATVLHEAKAAGHVLPARPQTTAEAFGAVDDGEPAEGETADPATPQKPDDENDPEKPAKPSPGIARPRRASLRPLTAITPRHYLIYPTHPRGLVGALAGPGGVAKSALSIAEAVAVVTGRGDVAGLPDDARIERASAWVHNQEDDQNGLDSRVAALMLHFDISPNAMDGSEGFTLYLTSGEDQTLSLARPNPTGKGIVVNKNLGQVSKYIRNRNIGLAIFDPVAELHEVEENAAGDMRQVWGALRTIATDTSAHVLCVTHTPKLDNVRSNAGFAGNPNIIRGSGAVVGSVRVVRTVLTMSEDEARLLKLDPAKRDDYMRVDDAKLNYAKKRFLPAWFERASVRADPTDYQTEIGFVRRVDLKAPVRSASDMLADRVAEVMRAKFAPGKPQALADVVTAVSDLSTAWGDDRAHWTELFRTHVLGGRQATYKRTLDGMLKYSSTRGRSGGSFVQFDPDRDVSGAFEAVEE